MNQSGKVADFFSKLNHPLKKEMETICEIIRKVSPVIEEDVKWGGPSYDYKEPLITISPRVKDYVALVFHKGEMLKDTTGLLEAAPKGKAYAKFYNMEDIAEKKDRLESVIKNWIKLMDATAHN